MRANSRTVFRNIVAVTFFVFGFFQFSCEMPESMPKSKESMIGSTECSSIILPESIKSKVKEYRKMLVSTSMTPSIVVVEFQKQGFADIYLLSPIFRQSSVRKLPPSFYSVVDGEVVLIYLGIEKISPFSEIHVKKLEKKAFSYLKDDITPKYDKNGSLMVEPPTLYHPDLWRVEMQLGEITFIDTVYQRLYTEVALGRVTEQD